ncbi:PT domain-containing protein, partial [Kouleothrix sp.]|uniref:PT domain-containing protein n=1 Tax=Kouleothrix sp. TaxID=2779161 RepID=UPI00391ABA5B
NQLILFFILFVIFSIPAVYLSYYLANLPQAPTPTSIAEASSPTSMVTLEPPTQLPTLAPTTEPTLQPTQTPTSTPEPSPTPKPTEVPIPTATAVPPTPVPPTPIPPTPIPPTPAPEPNPEGTDLGDGAISIIVDNSYFLRESDKSNQVVEFKITLRNNTGETMRVQINPRSMTGIDNIPNNYRTYLNELDEYKLGGCDSNVYFGVPMPVVDYTIEAGSTITMPHDESLISLDRSYSYKDGRCEIKSRLPFGVDHINVTIPSVRYSVGASSPKTLERLTWKLVFK